VAIFCAELGMSKNGDTHRGKIPLPVDPDSHSLAFFTGRAPETACQHTKSGHHCPPDENNTLRSQLPTQNDLPVKLSIFYGYKLQTLFNDQPRSIKCATS
jgi:hypothetical protein